VTKFGKPIGIKDYLEQDGTFMLQVKLHSGEIAEIAFTRNDALHFVETFQDATLRAAIAVKSPLTENAPNPQFKGLVLKRVLVGHSLPQPELLITTDEFASLILYASDTVLEQAQKAIKAVLGLREAKRKGIQ
jgi:hypothetical protein